MVITGMDAGLANGGIATVHVPHSSSSRPRVLRVDTVSTKPDDGDFGARLRLIYSVWETHLSEFRPEAISAEEQERALQGHQQRGTTNAKAFGAFAIFNVARGVALRSGLEFVILTPQEVKKSVGCSPSAEKKQVKTAVSRFCDGVPRVYSEHGADAIAAAIGGARRLRTQRFLGRRA